MKRMKRFKRSNHRHRMHTLLRQALSDLSDDRLFTGCLIVLIVACILAVCLIGVV